MKTYRDFVEKYANLIKNGKIIPFGNSSPILIPQIGNNVKKVLLFSPHPDDESIIGALPLRLMRELKMNVINVPVTYGSDTSRQKERNKELKNACDYLGFKILQIQENGLPNVKKIVKSKKPAYWNSSVEKIASIIKSELPYIVFIPHDNEFNATHAGTHEIVIDSLNLQTASFSCYVIEWEYWTPLEEPNLLFEVSRDDLAILITALSFHIGEVERNPQHVNLPAWMQDNVRRGAELIGAQGGKAPKFEFATIYRIKKWQNNKLVTIEKKQFASSNKILNFFQS